ncbi:MAG: ribonuclease [Bacteroidetes bacterium SW_11_45_7]|nr:MAG: ribonuclease [Bacteroidetes bacterium SW_11_45_7]
MAKTKQEAARKIFVLDTSVILYDHNAIHSFQEHDLAIPISVLEELDNFKKGDDTLNYEAREFIRVLDDISGNHNLNEWVSLNGKDKGQFKVLMNGNKDDGTAQKFGQSKMDNRILDAALSLKREKPDQKVVLVTKDINLRLKAKSLELPAEDYETGKIKNLEHLYEGCSTIEQVDDTELDDLHTHGFCDVGSVTDQQQVANHYYVLKSNNASALAYYNAQEERIERVDKPAAYGIQPRNAKQSFALHAILNPDVQLVTMLGVAGTGKTLLALAGAIEQRRNFHQIYLARPVISLAGAKLDPYMQPLHDNLKMIQNQFSEKDKNYKRINDMLEKEKLLITPLAYIRGRSLSKICFIVDEAQNLTPHEVKTIITRAGEDTKFIFTGDINQIDTPYLDKQSNGLSYLIDRMQDNALYAHIALDKGERSALANLANEVL